MKSLCAIYLIAVLSVACVFQAAELAAPVVLAYDFDVAGPANDMGRPFRENADAAHADNAIPLLSTVPVPDSTVSSFTTDKAIAAVSLSNLNQTYDGTLKVVTATTSPEDLPVSITYDGNPSAPTNAGRYDVVATVTAPNYAGRATGTFVITKGIATASLGNLIQGYDGAPKAALVTTNPAGLAVSLTYDGVSTPPMAPGTYVVEAEIADPNYSGAALDALTVTITALVRHAPTLYGAIDGSVQVLSDESFSLNDNAWVSGDLLVPGLPVVRMTGHPTYAGTLDGAGSALPVNHSVTLESNALLRHTLRRIDPIPLPAIEAPPAPAGARDVVIYSVEQDAGDFATLRDGTLNASAGVLAIPPGTYGDFTANNNGSFVIGVAGAAVPSIYNFQSLTLNDNGRIHVEGPVILVVAKEVSINGIAGSAAHPEWLTLEISAGGLTLNGGNAVFNGNVIAPKGTIVINDNGVLSGTIMADHLIISGNGLLKDPMQ